MVKVPRATDLSPESLWLREERRIERVIEHERRVDEWARSRRPDDPLPRQVVDAVDLMSEAWKRVDRLVEEHAELRRVERSTRALRTTQRSHLLGWLESVATTVSTGEPAQPGSSSGLWIDRGVQSSGSDAADRRDLPAGLTFRTATFLRPAVRRREHFVYTAHFANAFFHQAGHRESWRRRASRPWFRRWKRDAAAALLRGVAIQRLRELLESLLGGRRAAGAVPILARREGPDVDRRREQISHTIMPNAPSRQLMDRRLRQLGGQGVLAIA